MNIRFFIAFAPLLLTTSAWAKTFKTQFISFELPTNWSCQQEEIDWVCMPDSIAERADAMVVVVTKATNEIDDTLPKYEEVLNAKRAMRDLLGNSYMSGVKYVRRRTIKGNEWVDALHLGSEIPGFYSRYVAGIKEKVAGLLTYSVGESVYPKYAAQMDQMIDSLKLYFDPKAFSEAMNAGPTSLLGNRRGMANRLAPKMEDAKVGDTTGDGSDDKSKMIGFGILVAAVAFYIYKKRKA